MAADASLQEGGVRIHQHVERSERGAREGDDEPQRRHARRMRCNDQRQPEAYAGVPAGVESFRIAQDVLENPESQPTEPSKGQKP